MRKKFLKITIVAVLIIAMLNGIVNAFSFTATMTPSSTNVDPSAEFTIEVKVSNLDVGEKGINTLEAVLDYDTDVFEEIIDSSIDGINTWKSSYNAETKKILMHTEEFVKAEEQVFQITFKAKSDVEDGTVGEIKLTNIVASNSESDITASDVSTSITIGNANTNTTGNNTTNNTGNTNRNTNRNAQVITPTVNSSRNNTVNNSANNTNVNTYVPSYVNSSNSVNEEMPYTGIEDTLIYFIGAAIILSIVFYIKFEKVNKEMK